jgi:hypothetical protein
MPLHNLSRRAATDPRLRPFGNWDWPFLLIVDTKNVCVLLSPHARNCTSFNVILYLAHTVLLLKMLWGCITRMARSHFQLDAESQIILSLISEAYRICPSAAFILATPRSIHGVGYTLKQKCRFGHLHALFCCEERLVQSVATTN